MDDDSASETEENLTESEFWEELDDIVSTPCRTHERIDDTLRTWISLSLKYRESYLHTSEDIARCALVLFESSLFARHEGYVRRQLVFALLQEDDPATLHLLAAFLLLDGRHSDRSFELMRMESGFPRLIQFIKDGVHDDLGLHRLLLELVYEMARIQQIPLDDLNSVDDNLVLYLFQVIETLQNDVNDPYHDPVIRVLLVLNEQYMVSVHEPSDAGNSVPGITNRVIKALCTHGATYKTFGENIIRLLNRESEVSLQLLILKILYLLFTTPAAAEYFYTNDLHVLTDILIRNLLDLPADAISIPTTETRNADPPTTTTTSLRHTYLRVLHPLLAHTQLAQPPHYKREELRKLLFVIADTGHNHRHFERPDETTVRLVRRCLSVPWLYDPEDNIDTPGLPSTSEAANTSPTIEIDEPESATQSDNDGQLPPGTSSHVRAGKAVVADRALGMQLPEAKESSLSVVEVASQKERPGVIAPSRLRNEGASAGASTLGLEGSAAETAAAAASASVGNGAGLAALGSARRAVGPLSPVDELRHSPFEDG